MNEGSGLTMTPCHTVNRMPGRTSESCMLGSCNTSASQSIASPGSARVLRQAFTTLCKCSLRKGTGLAAGVYDGTNYRGQCINGLLQWCWPTDTLIIMTMTNSNQCKYKFNVNVFRTFKQHELTSWMTLIASSCCSFHQSKPPHRWRELRWSGPRAPWRTGIHSRFLPARPKTGCHWHISHCLQWASLHPAHETQVSVATIQVSQCPTAKHLLDTPMASSWQLFSVAMLSGDARTDSAVSEGMFWSLSSDTKPHQSLKTVMPSLVFKFNLGNC